MTSPWGPAYGGYDASEPVDPHSGQAAPPPPPPPNPYVNPGAWEPARYLPRATAPGTVLAGSIVGYVFAALLLISGLFLLFFGSILPDGLDAGSTGSGTSWVVAGFGNWLLAGLLVAGGVMAALRKPAGLVVELAAAGLVVVLAVYWVALDPSGAIVVWAVVHVIMGLVATGLVALPTANRAWLSGARSNGPAFVAPPPPPPFPVDGSGRPFGS